MVDRSKFDETDPEAKKAMLRFEEYVQACSLKQYLLDLSKIRLSQLNGSAFCLDMHTSEARQRGKNWQRLYALSA